MCSEESPDSARTVCDSLLCSSEDQSLHCYSLFHQAKALAALEKVCGLFPATFSKEVSGPHTQQ